jgi:polyhydroxybutyrate depolymerase
MTPITSADRKSLSVCGPRSWLALVSDQNARHRAWVTAVGGVLLAHVLGIATVACGNDALGSSMNTPALEAGTASGSSPSPADGQASSGMADATRQPDALASTTADSRAGTGAASTDTGAGSGQTGAGSADTGAGSADAGAGSADATATPTQADASLGLDAAEAASPPSVVTCTPGSVLPAGDTNGSIQVGDTMRTYLLHVPSSVTGQTPVPLVLDFHGLLTSSSYEQSISGYQALADQEGFVIAFPDGIDMAWNIGPCCTMSRTVDDLGFAKALVAEIEKDGCIDPKRVYAVGYSMGGGISHYLACNAADVFASIAPAAFDLLVDSEEPCHPSRPITEITFRGTADTIVPYAGGASNPPNGLNVTIHFLGAQGTFQKWAQLDGCVGSPSAADSNGCSTYSQCSGGVEVTLCTTQGGGHSPGDPNIAWPMLKKHPMP